MLLHDLAAPARHVGFFLRQLIESLPEPTPNQLEWMRLMHENLVTQTTLLRDARLLLAHERQPKDIWREPIRGTSILDDIIASFRPEFDERGVVLRVELSSDPPLHVDPQALARIVSNLLGNALKATPPGGTITLSSRREGSTMMFSVSDTGGGFTPQEAAGLSRRLDEFERGIEPPDIWGGLGLLVCHSIVLRYGGHLSMVSQGPGLGSTFSFGLRVASDLEDRPIRSPVDPDDSDVRSSRSKRNPLMGDANLYGE